MIYILELDSDMDFFFEYNGKKYTKLKIKFVTEYSFSKLDIEKVWNVLQSIQVVPDKETNPSDVLVGKQYFEVLKNDISQGREYVEFGGNYTFRFIKQE
jgi:hypothetical protein